ncbi:hypothetical protein LMG24238_06194 [Paraburkholderia sediminicola]|uniref:Uncharacterized protein n=1 Tax=Paraburkholderia sediminicola TaxID=458836 RepID=A0A6J5CIK8_9BURK|nr:hypothetical protein [Paraburkholderia sediminicola]CAB3736091.1 hypothetical protein LMG24238_06194 [Paraburkholderia sediminicola]
MITSTIQFTVGAPCHWAGMGDYVLLSPDQSYKVSLRYVGEPPQGDSYHLIDIAGRRFPGYAWGSMFTISACSRFVAFSWMPEMFERLTVVADVRRRRYCVLPQYIYEPHFVGETVFGRTTRDGVGEGSRLDDLQAWHSF